MAKKVYDEKINKSQDWGGDASTGNLPVAGGRVQEFIKEQLDMKAGVFHYDTTNNRYIVFADEESKDAYLADPTKAELIIGTFDAPFNYSAEIALSSPTYVAILADTKSNYIDFTFDTKNKNGQSVGEDAICTYTFIKAGIKKVVTEKYRYGQAVHFNIDDYISTGTNTITVGIVGQNTLAATTVGITYQVVDLQLSDTYDISQAYNLISNPAATAAIPYQVRGYGTKIMEWYLDGVQLDYVKVEDEIVDVSTTRTKYISLANLSQGIHSLQYRAYTMLDGEKFYSNILYRDLIVVTGVNKNPIIAVSATIPVGNDIITSGNLQLYGIIQYIPYDLTFAVYNPSSVASTDVVIAIDGKTEAAIQAHNGEVAAYSVRPTEYGVKSMTITTGTTIYPIGLNITKSSTSLEPITDGLQLDMMALGKSNNDANKEEWAYGPYSATFSGFNWNKTSGWNNNRLLVTSGAYVDINLAPLSPDPTSSGKTLEFEFATANVSDDNAVICDLRNPSGTGLLITASEVILKSAGGAEVSTKFKSEENIRVAFVINRKTGVANKGLAFVYVNGVLSGAVNYSSTDNFTSDKLLRIGNTTLVDVQLKALRFYNTALNSDQILNNYTLYRDTTEELLSIYDKNSIYEDGTQNFSVDKLAAQCPVFIFTGDIPALENTTDKNKTIYVDVEYINMQDPSKSFTGKGIRLRPQGTSSMGYPKKNFRPYTGYGEVWDNLGNIMINGLYSFKEGSQPVNVWCLKADYAESSGTHNTGIARLWNQVMTNAQVNGEYVLRTEAQKAAIAAGYKYDVRTTVDGFPCHVLYRLTADSELIYIGKYNFNNDKSTESVFGFRDIPGFDNSKMQCWEVLNNGNHLALFQDTTNFDIEWDQAFESRYPDGSENTTDLKAFCEWIVSTKNDIAKFKSEKWDHLDVYKVAAYYVYLMRFGAVDQVVKNAMLTSEDGRRFYYINYDNDTIIGVRNDGLLIYDYEIDRQTVDSSFSALVYAYAGHDSTLWNNLEADEEFMQIVAEVDNALYMAGLSYEKTIDMFDAQQSGKWCERVYNQDAQYKYVGPFTDSGVNNLFMLQGSRSAHRRWWLSHRFDLLDSKFVSGAYKAKSIEFKAANAPVGLQFSITSGNGIYYGYGLNNVPVETGIKLAPGESHTFTTKQVINVGDPVRIYSAVNVQELDVHDFISYLSTLNIAEVYNETVGTRLKKLVMGVNTTTDERRNTSLSVISGLLQAKRLEYLDISGYQAITDLDLSAHAYFKTLKAYGSGLTGIIFANGAPVTTLELPSTLQSLALDSLPNLQASGLNVANEWKSVYSILIRNCDQLQAAPLIFNWYSKKTADNGQCSLFLEGIEWNNVDAASLISLGSIKTAGGTLSVKGIIHLASITPAQVDELKSIFGESCFNQDNEIYITAPDGVFVNGPAEVLEGTTAQYTATIFSDYKGRVEYWLVDSSGSLVGNYNDCTINLSTGLLSTTVVDRTRTIKIRVKHIPTQGAFVTEDLNVTVKGRIYPSRASILGGDTIAYSGDFRYDLETSNFSGAVTGDFITDWSISGGSVTEGYVRIKSQDKSSCVIHASDVPMDSSTSFVLTANVKKIDGTQLTSTTKTINVFAEGIAITKKTNPEVMAICYEQGWAEHEDYMTKDEAAAVGSIGSAFSRTAIKTFNEFEHFTSVTEVPDSAFQYCNYLTSIKLPNSITIIGGYAFNSNTQLSEVTLPMSLVNIGTYAFKSNSRLISIVLPEGLTTLGYGAFSGCQLLKSINFPNSIKELPGSLFYACGFETLVIPDTITKIGDYCFDKCWYLQSLTLPDNLATINTGIIRNCIELTEITIPKGTTNISYSFCETCFVLENIYVDEENASFKSIDGVVMNKAGDTLVAFPYGRKTYTVPAGITNIGEAFRRHALLESIILSDDMETVNDYAFEGCTALASIDLKRITSIGRFSFNGIGLVSFTSPDTLISVGMGAFEKCNNLESVVLNEGLLDLGGTNIGDYGVFRNCKKLLSITLPSTLTNMNMNTLNGCSNLATIISRRGVAVYAYNVFGTTASTYTGRNNYDKGTNILYVPAGATGYDTGAWLDPLQNEDKCGFTISYTL